MTTAPHETTFRAATLADAAMLAQMNHRLIRDEGHRNPMTARELARRMEGFLAADWRATVFEQDAAAVGYALYRCEAEYVYLRQLFVEPERRRQGIGRQAIEWLRRNAWADAPCGRVRIEVLAGNQAAIAFWRSLGFVDYALTMELG